MAVFVRKNALIVTASFTAADGTATQPTTANAVVNYADQAGTTHNVSLPMTYDPIANAWSASWDSSAAGQGNVEWMVYGVGLAAAAQGQFQLAANLANTV